MKATEADNGGSGLLDLKSLSSDEVGVECTALIFSLNETRYGIDTSFVREIVPLPELTPTDEVPFYITGEFNLRGTIVPVVDLNARLSHPQTQFDINDNVIILEKDEEIVGVAVSSVDDVTAIAKADLEAPASSKLDGAALSGAGLVIGEARIGKSIVHILDCEKITACNGDAPGVTIGERSIAPLSEEAVEIFKERAANLIKEVEDIDISGLVPLAVFSLAGELFGVGLSEVREFSEFVECVPIPCSPKTIVGNMNLRGEILTLIDMAVVLNMPLTNKEEAAKVIVSELDGRPLGIPVDDVFDLLYVGPSDISKVPVAVKSVKDEYLKGTVIYEEKMLGVLDLGKLLSSKEIVVSEEV